MNVRQKIDTHADAMQVQSIDTMAGLAALEGEWRALQSRDPDAGVFLSYDWMRMLLGDNPGQWRVLVARAQGRAAAILPLRYRVHWSGSQRRYESYVAAAGRFCFSEYTGFICDPRHEDAALASLAHHLSASPWTRLSLRYEPTLRRTKRFAAAFDPSVFDVDWPGYTINGGTTNQLLCPQVSLPDSIDAWLAGISRNTRKKIRKAWRRHFDSGEVAVRGHTAAGFERVRETLLDHWRDRWAQDDRSGRLARVEDKYRTMINRAEQIGVLYMPSLWQGDRMLGALAYVLDARAGAAHCLLTGRDTRVEDIDVGLLMHSHAIAAAIKAGLRTYDFGHGTEAYKYSYGAVEKPVAYLAITRKQTSALTCLDPLSVKDARARGQAMLASGRTKDATFALQHLSDLKATTYASGASTTSSSP